MEKKEKERSFSLIIPGYEASKKSEEVNKVTDPRMLVILFARRRLCGSFGGVVNECENLKEEACIS